ncbi:MAG: endonuclease/exonuclease/phosphatase family protein [Fimbriimonadaceae bacterium]|nr:endonuclease/exonuclease/phosphatase family protein [Fimbriimonadaceae bacterium]
MPSPNLLLGLLLCLALVGCSSRATAGFEAEAQPANPNVVRLATWNLEWFTERENEVRLARIRSGIDRMRPDILALQEVESVAAARRALPPDYSIVGLDSPDERQELLLAVKAPAKVVSHEMAFPDPRDDDAFPNRRDVLRARVQVGPRVLTVYVVHMKSRGGGRLQTDDRRIRAAHLLAEEIRRRKDPNVIVLGDFNDTPNDRSLKVLESGDLRARPGSRPSAPILLNLLSPLYDDDFVTLDLDEVDWRLLKEPRVPGSKQENERFRDRVYNFRQDVRIKPSLFDQILISPDLRQAAGPAHILFSHDLIEGDEPRVQDGRVTVPGTRASDHLPVWVELRFGSAQPSGSRSGTERRSSSGSTA